MAITASRPEQGLPSPPTASRTRPTSLLTALGAVAAGLALEFSAGADRIVNPFLPVLVTAALMDSVLGHLIGRRHPRHPLARVLQLAGLLAAAVVLTGGYANAALFGPLPEPGATLALWLSRWLWVPSSAVSVLGLLLLFPDGRLPSPRWRPAAALAAGGPVLLTVHFATMPFTESLWRAVPVANPLAVVPQQVSLVLEAVAHPLWALGVAVGSAAVVVRRHRAVGDERRRFRLVVVPAVLLPFALLAAALTEVGGLAEMVVATWLAIAVTVAMVRHRMFDLDVVVNRTMVHGLLVVSLFGAYVTVVALVSEVVGGDVSWPAGVVAALVVATLTGPLLSRLRTGVDRLMYGDRGRPDAVAGRLAVATTRDAAGDQPADVLTAAAEALRDALRVPWVRVEVGSDRGAAGDPRTEGREVDIRLGAELLGRLCVGARWDGERFTATDEQALEAAARQLGVTAEAYLLARRLADARERLVSAREDERRRIRRDLHDGLGPSLAGITAALEGLEEVARSDPGVAAAALPGLRAQARAAVVDVRRLVDGLRPPALDELGLAGALAEELRRLQQATGVRCALAAPERVPALPAAVEVAALRIALEAATNVVRHASAATCAVALEVGERDVAVRVDDDGTGVPADVVPGVGLTSMRERAEEIGGTCTVAARPGGGTRVSAVLPLPRTPGVGA
ncbi:sensor histidine kinase [Blastococcus saxobsidens]|uniref:Oxygen sensor histidine kinase NreB n=1 Tax=Blastococcus saxobsidens (strain DD2) TaxID=1146883 RepID=H6RST8_BLASD|nr:sensor histidine kinase [Blastococcus saxobsidens]CCG03041.1 Two component sensor histidine kinase [Blastococcus saxobsidens DD2]